MYNFYTNMLPEQCRAWRNAYEIQMAALEHEKRRSEMKGECVSTGHPIQANRPSGWSAAVKALWQA